MKQQAHIITEALEAIGELEIKRIYSWVLRRSISDALSPGLQRNSSSSLTDATLSFTSPAQHEEREIRDS
ncbi:hypothetical protein FISHEDRAFT_74116 [Fistulina hepatica ATCC 64428]|uniref:Uncharacterized protein n=1 Tax=Fistulina hepatica ATCC 64428 TaxID=1128425 RepID=A0A0D7AAE2_9AGAR|nr:hypothetical protein FISHEDRAFT_74116 [Fistulina hepatica ATCC 64428]